jgi:hypothetical protein
MAIRKRRRNHKCRHGRFVIPGSKKYSEASDQFDTLASWDPFTAYDPLLSLYDEGNGPCACASSSSAWTILQLFH